MYAYHRVHVCMYTVCVYVLCMYVRVFVCADVRVRTGMQGCMPMHSHVCMYVRYVCM